LNGVNYQKGVLTSFPQRRQLPTSFMACGTSQIQIMSDSVYSEINFHITWHTKTSLPMIGERIENRLYHYLTHKIIETPGARLHAIGGIETHIHIATSLPPNLLVSEWIGKLKGASSYYINHEVESKSLEWQRGYGIVTFGMKDLQWVI
jgi:putative transposase